MLAVDSRWAGGTVVGDCAFHANDAVDQRDVFFYRASNGRRKKSGTSIAPVSIER